MTLLTLILKQSQQKLKLENYKPFLVTSIYRPPGKPVAYFHDIELLVRDIDNQNIESIIMGDTNCNFMDKSNNDTKKPVENNE